jgi:hypothetical protein
MLMMACREKEETKGVEVVVTYFNVMFRYLAERAV